ncbi:bifunctional 5,10-methylenetetrahydrofolate dehydrogenase/5,10-methenyltetrahydrofolate cyclohydrolase [Candidatus Micrarchaeota archaeon]|nr:bifunctional 5,10-methylenetetrahydrofolate dehydrogenase/5,10-methenyltetrahydrofolate cyclohydrolase [Candidatus Micrarchaeota archaeon]
MLLYGKPVAEKILSEIKTEVGKLKEKPRLSIILVGKNPASEIYVNKKLKIAGELGVEATLHEFGEGVKEEDLLEEIKELNESEEDGIMVQLPLPKHIDEKKVLETINPEKDVDGFHPCNLGKLMIGNPAFVSATPYGIMHLLEHYGIELEGKEAVVVGRSNIVGKPMGILLLNKNATVTLCHSRTRNLEEHTKRADVLVVAVGKAGLIKKKMVKKGAVVVDVGINRVNGKVVGDVERDVEEIAKLTPVPGGVGPLTVAMLMKNTLNAAKLRLK